MKKNILSLFIALLCCVSTWATEGALSGRFTINSNGDQIVFSQGNLQYQPSTGIWRFATNQYDYITFDINAYSASSEKWIDLFAYGTSGYNNGQTNYQPYVVGAAENTYYQSNLTGNADWGYNAISNGGNTENSGWRTLTRDEWIYLFSGRTNAASKYGHGSINGVNGMILLPDKWTTPDGLSFTPSNSIWTNSYTIEQWNWMQKAGAVFLPASGSCNNAGIPSESLQNQNGFYRAGTAAYYVYFAQGSIQNCTMSFHQYGDAVRLVQAAPVEQYPLQQDKEGYYLLSTAQNLRDFAALVQTTPTANAKVMNDIDLAGNEDNQWTPIGTESHKYKGTFDGQGHTIKNLYWHGNNQPNIGLFGYADGAKIMNLRLEDADIYDLGQDGNVAKFVGGIIGHSSNGNTLVINCSFSGSVTGTLEVGSMIGGGPAKVINCYNEGTVTFTSLTHYAAGGIYGYNSNGITINNCYNVGDVINNGNPTDYMGAICYHGVTNSYYRENCCQNGSTAGWSNQGPGTVMSLDNMKTVVFVATLNANVASLQATYPDISEWVQDPVTNLPILKIFAKAHDLVENQLEQDEEGNYLIGSVQDWKDFAALVNGGSIKANAKMTANINLGNDQTMIGSGTSEPDQNGSTNIKYQGTFDGQGHTLTIHYVAEEDITAPFRFIQEATIKNLRVNGNITTAFHHAGGIVGTCFGQQKHSYIENCISSVNIISSYVNNSDFYGGAWHGGIAARLHYYGQLHIKDCIFKGSISGENKGVVWGGMLGFPDGTATFTNCLQIGTFDCSDVIGGSNGSGTISTVFSNGYASHININNCHYLNAIGNVQGTQATVEQLADGTTTTALQAGREDEIWVQKGSTPMLKIFESESEPIEPTIWEGGVLPGKFTINSNGDQIVFSQGNLQYQAAPTPKWQFATNQYDMIGGDNANISDTYTGWIDLFCWNSATNPTQTDESNPASTFVDWGTNPISNGGNVANAWRTLSGAEWIYIFENRTNAATLIGQGSIDGVNGLIILPDNWTLPTGLTFTPKPNNYTTNVYTATEWGYMQDNGAVFLPAGGWRSKGAIVYTGEQNSVGGYHPSNQNPAFTTALSKMYFTTNSISGYSLGSALKDAWNVRLVQAAPACNIPPTDIYETACDSFPWLGTMYYASGDISKTFKAVNGCDSVVTLHLTINNSNTGEEYKTAESSYEWHGTTYTASGDYTYTLTNVAGCDSVATLHLTITPPPPVWENGALPGKFTINSNGDQIVFSQGNLQYRATTDTWRFAIYQYDMIGADNTNISATYDGWIDLIQWGAGNNPTTTATYTYNTFVEFGSHAISNGGNVADAWRTMTNDEWVYIFHGRANAEDRVGLGSVNGINGVIILPDTWTTPDGLTFNPGPANGLTWQTSDGYYKSSATDCYSHNTYTPQQWGTMESNGAVFLPAAGDRYIGTKSIQQLGTGGYYWSSTKTSSTHANVAGFGANIINPQHNSMQDYGHSIRLVQAAPKPAQPSWVLAGDTWDEATKTLTVNSNPGVRAYQHKTDIVNLIFSDGVTNIGTYAFLECTSLISITFANTLTEIGSRAFDDCNNLPSVEIPNSVETIGEGAFYFCKSLISLTIGNNVKTIGEFAFYSCYALNSITIPNSVETIGKYAFLLAKSATSLTIGNSVKSIGEHAFYRCYALTSITIPGNVESIDKDAFGFCTDLTSVTCEAVNPPAVGKGIFSDSDKLAHIYVPAGSVANYKTAANWSDYAAIIEAIPGSENITVTWDAAFIDYVEAFNHLGTIVHYDNSKDGITVTYSGPASNIGKGMQSYIVKLTTSDKLTFTSTVGDIKKIEITYTSMSGTAPAGWTANDPTLTWEGTPAAAVELPGAIELPRITSIVFIVDKTATAIEEISQQPTTNSQKLMIDGQLYIFHNGILFDMTGKEVK